MSHAAWSSGSRVRTSSNGPSARRRTATAKTSSAWKLPEWVATRMRLTLGVGRALVGDELQQRPVGIAEVHRQAGAAGAVARDGPQVDRDAVRLEMRHGLLDRALPDEREVGHAGSGRDPRHRNRVHPRPWTLSCWSPKR